MEEETEQQYAHRQSDVYSFSEILELFEKENVYGAHNECTTSTPTMNNLKLRMRTEKLEKDLAGWFSLTA
jgi:hypothetical protein